MRDQESRRKAAEVHASRVLPGKAVNVVLQHGDGQRESWYVTVSLDGGTRRSASGPDLDDVLMRLCKMIEDEAENASP